MNLKGKHKKQEHTVINIHIFDFNRKPKENRNLSRSFCLSVGSSLNPRWAADGKEPSVARLKAESEEPPQYELLKDSGGFSTSPSLPLPRGFPGELCRSMGYPPS